ncbi:MAG TPA: hypothetical protein VJK30_00250 [Coxiellaceae bacterium]|nr:MAG: hypothetical protein A3E81_08480 [Gammaproteobacteria bacterium RIFCSPHIGHO2_12_FULL_36_30]HLB55747.1 hypothetical protein [Coxiellaceae bacterium]
MKKSFWIKSIACAALMVTGVALADAPADMLITNDTGYYTNAYVHNNPGQPLGPHKVETIPWTTVANLCHGTSTVKDADPCAFEVYLSRKASNPEQIDFATVTFYVSNGNLVDINYVTHVKGLKIDSPVAGQFTLKHA